MSRWRDIGEDAWPWRGDTWRDWHEGEAAEDDVSRWRNRAPHTAQWRSWHDERGEDSVAAQTSGSISTAADELHAGGDIRRQSTRQFVSSASEPLVSQVSQPWVHNSAQHARPYARAAQSLPAHTRQSAPYGNPPYAQTFRRTRAGSSGSQQTEGGAWPDVSASRHWVLTQRQSMAPATPDPGFWQNPNVPTTPPEDGVYGDSQPGEVLTEASRTPLEPVVEADEAMEGPNTTPGGSQQTDAGVWGSGDHRSLEIPDDSWRPQSAPPVVGDRWRPSLPPPMRGSVFTAPRNRGLDTATLQQAGGSEQCDTLQHF